MFFRALAVERETYRRGFALMLLTACRIQEIAQAKASSIRDGVWYREASDVKNGEDHAIPLGAWGRALAVGGSEWVLPCENDPKKPQRYVWYKVRDRLIKRMTEASGGPVGHWKPHDLRRTVRSNTRRFGIGHLTAEAMLAHKLPAGVERIYDRHDPIDDLRRAYGAWEAHLAAIVREAGLGEVFGLPVPQEAEIAAAA
nr:tyrosine-type recombinase/integrase [Sphingomonas yabuuchiae]